MRSLPITAVVGAFVCGIAITACGGDPPVAPTPAPIPAANIVASGTMNISGCFQTGASRFSCEFNATATNQGTGCASNVRGSTVAFDSAHNQTGSSQWVYFLTVRPGERFVYSGFSLTVPSTDWTYNTQVSWDNVRCP